MHLIALSRTFPVKRYKQTLFCHNRTLQLFNKVRRCNMVRKLNFRLLYRVVFLSFCLSFACFYHDEARDSEYKRKFRNGKFLNDKDFPKKVKYVSLLKADAKQMDSGKPLKKTDVLKTFVKGKS